LRKKGYDSGKTARIREKFFKSGQGRKWLDDKERMPESAQGGISSQLEIQKVQLKL